MIDCYTCNDCVWKATWEELLPAALTGSAVDDLMALTSFCVPAPEGKPMAIVQSRHGVLLSLNRYCTGT